MDTKPQARQIAECFGRNDVVYLREDETERIKAFLSTGELLFHITGRPGTGKTATVRSALAGMEYQYVNYFLEPGIGGVLRRSRAEVVVIDEFDKYLEERRRECLKALLGLRGRRIKVITISNDLKMGNLRFKPYTAEELGKLIRLKMAELGNAVMGEETVQFLAKRHERSGDVRTLFKTIATAASKKNKGFLEIRDFIDAERRTERGIHHEMTERIKSEELDRRKAYGKYLLECEELAITPVTKTEFNIIFDMTA